MRFILTAVVGLAAAVGPHLVAGPDRWISGPFTHENLAVFLIHARGATEGHDYLTIEEAVSAGALRVSECADASVPQLTVENVGDRAIFMQAGDTLKGGKQDRAIGSDVVLPPRSGPQAVRVFCVEPGRWAAQAGADAGFSGGAVSFATKEQRLALRLERDQSSVWRSNARGNLALGDRCGNLVHDSFVSNVEDPLVRAEVDKFVAALRHVAGGADIVGFAFAVNGRVNSADVYAHTGLFRKQWPRLLRACAIEALVRSREAATGIATRRDVDVLLAESLRAPERDRTTGPGVECRTRLGSKYVSFESTFGGSPGHIGCSRLD